MFITECNNSIFRLWSHKNETSENKCAGFDMCTTQCASLDSVAICPVAVDC